MKNQYNQIYAMRYMGSKLHLLDFIIPKIESITSEGDKILDLMAGTHSVGYALKQRHPIIANDIQEYSRIIGLALIANNRVNLTSEDIKEDILDKLRENYSHHLFQKYYPDTYFSEKQCKEIDKIRYAIDLVKDIYKKALYLTCLIYAMGYCQSSPGHFAEYMPKDHPRLEPLRKLSILKAFLKKCREIKIIFSKYENLVLAQNYKELLKNASNEKNLKNVKLIYVDSPYTSAQYSRFYHLLETIAKYDYPKLNYKGLYRNDRFQSNFCYASKVKKEFDFILNTAKSLGAKIVISYSNRGLITPNEIKNLCKASYKRVDLFSYPYNHSMQGRGVLKDTNEILVVCQ